MLCTRSVKPSQIGPCCFKFLPSAQSRIVHPGERVEHLKEEDEGRDEQPLGKANAAQLHHQ